MELALLRGWGVPRSSWGYRERNQDLSPRILPSPMLSISMCPSPNILLQKFIPRVLRTKHSSFRPVGDTRGKGKMQGQSSISVLASRRHHKEWDRAEHQRRSQPLCYSLGGAAKNGILQLCGN